MMTPQKNPTLIRAESTSPHGVGNRLGRVAWGVVYTVLFRPSPRNLHRWRNWLLRLFGANLHPTARVYPRARCWLPANLTMGEYATISDDVDVYCVAPVTIGPHTTVSQYTYLCGATHDFEALSHPLVPGPIVIGRRCWIAADVFVGPGITIHDGAVVGARSTVLNDVPAWTVAVGTPARPLRARTLGPEDFGDQDGSAAGEPG